MAGQGKQSTNDEILSRARRIETRLTQLCLHVGVETQAQKPEFCVTTGEMRLRSLHCPVQEIIAAIPEGWTSPVKLIIGGQHVGHFTPGGD